MSALTDTFTAIANAIRGKLGVQTTYTPTQMSSAIASIPTAKEEQTKSVTATTSQQTVAPDSGKVLSSVTVNPQIHSATYTPTGYSNANDMGAQNNYRYVDTSAYEPTSITPSNSSPANIASGGIYQATANGKAVSLITDITPSATPTAVAADDIVHIGGIGTVVDALTEVRPSNGSPIAVSVGDNIKITNENGYAIKNYSAVTPDNRYPISMSKNDIAKFDASGEIVKEVDNVTPSDTSPVSVSFTDIVKPSSAGYLYKTQKPHFPFMAPDKVYQGNIASSGSATISVTQKPRFIVYGAARYTSGSTASDGRSFVVMIDVTNSKVYQMVYSGSAYAYGDSTYSNFVNSISSSSVVLKNPYGVTVRGHAAIYY